MKNRKITKNEINKITQKCKPREKAFFTIMKQSGLPPHTIKQLKIKHVEKILEPDTPIPCKINIPQKKFPTFIGNEATEHLKDYLIRRKNPTLNDLLFTIHNKPNRQINTKNITKIFKRITQKLEKAKQATYNLKKEEPNKLTPYHLIKFYREKAKAYLNELKRDQKNHTIKNDEYYRKLYEKEAMYHLETEQPSKLYQLDKRLHELENTHKKIENILTLKQEYIKTTPEEQKQLEYAIEIHENELKWQKENPEEYEKQMQKTTEDWEKHERWLKEHPEEAKREEEIEQKLYEEYLEAKITELKDIVNKITNTIEKHRQTTKKHTTS
jgi:hypothetical protein